MREYLVNLFKKTFDEVIDKVVYLTQGMLYPVFIGIEIGIAEKMALRALAMTTGPSISKMEEELKTKGDI